MESGGDPRNSVCEFPPEIFFTYKKPTINNSDHISVHGISELIRSVTASSTSQEEFSQFVEETLKAELQRLGEAKQKRIKFLQSIVRANGLKPPKTEVEGLKILTSVFTAEHRWLLRCQSEGNSLKYQRYNPDRGFLKSKMNSDPSNHKTIAATEKSEEIVDSSQPLKCASEAQSRNDKRAVPEVLMDDPKHRPFSSAIDVPAASSSLMERVMKKRKQNESRNSRRKFEVVDLCDESSAEEPPALNLGGETDNSKGNFENASPSNKASDHCDANQHTELGRDFKLLSNNGASSPEGSCTCATNNQNEFDFPALTSHSQPCEVHQLSSPSSHSDSSSNSSSSHSASPSRIRLCRQCNFQCPIPTRSFCSSGCLHLYKLRSSSSYVRRCLMTRDQGVCQMCHLDCEKLRRSLNAQLRRVQGSVRVKQQYAAMMAEKLGRPCPKHLKVNRRGIITSGSVFHADHILAVVEGGGNALLQNFRLLCVNCHREVTSQLMKGRKKQQKAKDGEKQINEEKLATEQSDKEIKDEKSKNKTVAPCCKKQSKQRRVGKWYHKGFAW